MPDQFTPEQVSAVEQLVRDVDDIRTLGLDPDEQTKRITAKEAEIKAVRQGKRAHHKGVGEMGGVHEKDPTMDAVD